METEKISNFSYKPVGHVLLDLAGESNFSIGRRTAILIVNILIYIKASISLARTILNIVTEQNFKLTKIELELNLHYTEFWAKPLTF